MSTPWGPAFDAEIAYRQQRARTDYRPRGLRARWARTTIRVRRPAPAVTGVGVGAQ